MVMSLNDLWKENPWNRCGDDALRSCLFCPIVWFSTTHHSNHCRKMTYLTVFHRAMLRAKRAVFKIYEVLLKKHVFRIQFKKSLVYCLFKQKFNLFKKKVYSDFSFSNANFKYDDSAQSTKLMVFNKAYARCSLKPEITIIWQLSLQIVLIRVS